MTTSAIIRNFGTQVRAVPGIEPDIIETLVEFKESYFSDPDPAHWTVEVLAELMVGLLPRKVTAPDEWFVAVAPTVTAYLTFLTDERRLAPGSDPAHELLTAVEKIGDQALAASRDPRNFGMAKSIFSSVSFDPSAPDAAQSMMDSFNAGPYGATLPTIWLPPVEDLVDQIRAAGLVRDLGRLTTWVGSRRKVTRQNLLPLAEARRACADLDLPLPTGKLQSAGQIPALHRLWGFALDSDLLAVDRSVVRPGDGAALLADPEADPDEILSWWIELFDTVLIEGLETGEPEDDAAEMDVVRELVEELLPTTLVELYSCGRVPLASLDQLVTVTVGEVLGAPVGGATLPDEELHEETLLRWRQQLAHLVDVGAAVTAGDDFDLTPLGRAGIRAMALDDGGEAELIDDPATLDTAALLRLLPPLGSSVSTPMVLAWAANRPLAEAIDLILDAARSGTASTRMASLAALKEGYAEHLTGPGVARLETLRTDPVLAAYAHVLLTELGRPEPLPAHLAPWTALETVALALERDVIDRNAPGYDADALTFLWQFVDEHIELDSVATSPHPQRTEVLEAIAGQHPRGRTRKAAKKALFKLRNGRV